MFIQKYMDGTLVAEEYAKSIAAINNIIATAEDEVGIDELEEYAESKRVEAIKAQKITFYFGDQVIGEVKFIKAGSKAEKIDRCKKTLMKKEIAINPDTLIGRMLYSPFCIFKIL